MISIYSSAFNLIKNNFKYEFAIDNFCSIADEIIIAINTSDDNSFEELNKLTSRYKNLQIISCDYSYDDPLLDGKIKNFALQQTKHKVKIGLDMDEYIPLSQKDLWIALSDLLLMDNCMCYMIPSVNLYKDHDHFTTITPKWYMHKSGLYRGPVNFARKDNGYIDTSKSDTCELIDSEGNLVSSKAAPSDIESLRTGSYPFVVHTGYLDLQDRLLRNHNFWHKHWYTESGGIAPQHKIHTNIEDFTEISYKHELNI